MTDSQSQSILQIATDYKVVRRALVMSLIVGTILISINHCNCCLAKGAFGTTCLIQAALTYCVPFAVSTISSVQAIRCRERGRPDSAPPLDSKTGK